MEQKNPTASATIASPEVIAHVMEVIRRDHIPEAEMSTIVLCDSTKVSELPLDEDDFLDLRIQLEQDYGVREIPEYAFDGTETIGDIALMYQRALNGEDLDPDASIQSFIPEGEEDADYQTVTRRAADVEFYDQGERKARIRRVLQRWEQIESADGSFGMGGYEFVTLDPNGPDHPRQTYQMEQLCEDGCWRIVGEHSDPAYVKQAAERWVREGGEIEDFQQDTLDHGTKTKH